MPYHVSRMGRFRIDNKIMCCLYGEQALNSQMARGLMGLFGQMIIIRATDAPHRDAVDYWAVGECFEELAEGEMVPWYEIEFQTIDHGEDYADSGHAHQFESLVKAFKRKPPGETW